MTKSAILPDFSIESRFMGQVCGIDEAGRGPLAGPVVAAAVILDRLDTPVGINDSKTLVRSKRELLFKRIIATSQVGVGFASVEEIDKINILNATMAAMERAVVELGSAPNVALVDGNRVPKLSCATYPVVGGDRRSLSIAAASIVSKVTRDHLMTKLSIAHPGYGWDRNVGYGTEEHMEALSSLGVTPHHRKSFAPVNRTSR